MFDVKRFLNDYHIEFIEHGPNWQPGWVQVQCPMPGCNDSSSHGGFRLLGGYHCWKCGKHKITDVITALIGTNKHDSWNIIKKYETSTVGPNNDEKKTYAESVELPFGSGELRKEHKKYLRTRNFDPDKLVNLWNLKGTGHRGFYKFRIIAPIYLNHRLVSFQGRDITGKQELRYKTCEELNEVVHHKHMLYGIDHISKRKCVVVEGITDVWRLGYGAVATFGTGFTQQQALMLSKRCDKVFLMFDKEAELKMEKFDMMLQGLGVETEEIEFEDVDDPAEFDDLTAKRVMKRLLG